MYGYFDFCIWGIANNYIHHTRKLFHRIAGVLKHLFWCLSQNQALSNGIGITVKQVLQCKKMSPAPIVLNDSLLPQNNLAVISYRCESGNINLVVLDKLLFLPSKPHLFYFSKYFEDRPTDQPTDRPTTPPVKTPPVV